MRHEVRGPVEHRGGRSAELEHALRYGPFSRALSEAIRCRGLSLSRVCAHLAAQDVTIAQSTLSYWQRGLRHPLVPRALDAVRALERVLLLPRDSLVVLVGPHQRAAGVARRVVPIPELSRSWERTGALLAEFDGLSGSPCNSDLDVVTVFDDVRFTSTAIAQVASTVVVRARRSGPDGFAVIHQSEPGAVIDTTTVRADDGCRVGRERRDASAAGMVFELLFDRRLTEGDVHAFSFTLEMARPVPTCTFSRLIRERMHAYLVRLHFDPVRLPVRCARVCRPREDLEPTVSEPLLCGPTGFTCAYFEDLDPSLAGVEVLWP